MNNEIYEADYTRKDEPSSDTGIDILELAKTTGFFRVYDELMRSMPKYINQTDNQNYEELLPTLAQVTPVAFMAKRMPSITFSASSTIRR